MSLIYPNVLDDSIIKDRRRRAEVLVFNALKNTQLYSTTKIYYSCDWLNTVSERDAQSDGECDFIITDTTLGVIFIEVKGGFISKDDQGNWYTNNTIEIKNPIQQALKSKHIIIREWKKRWKEKNPHKIAPRVFYGHYVILPDSSNQSGKDLGLFANIKQFFYSSREYVYSNCLSLKQFDFFEKNVKTGSQLKFWPKKCPLFTHFLPKCA